MKIFWNKRSDQRNFAKKNPAYKNVDMSKNAPEGRRWAVDTSGASKVANPQ